MATNAITPNPNMQSSLPPSYAEATGSAPKQENRTEMQEQPVIAETAPFTTSSLSDSSIRRKFIMKVYLILTAQLLVTVAFVAIFQFVEGVKDFVQTHLWVYISAIVAFVVIYLVLICSKKARRSYPGNFIALFLFTLVFSYMAATIASFHDFPAVVMACVMTVGITLSVSLFVAFVKIDITLCVSLLLALVVGTLLFGLSVSLGYLYFEPKYGMGYGLQSVYGGLISIIFAFILAIDTWLVLNKDGLSEEEYVYAALQLYIDIVYIFLILLGFSRRS